MENDFSAVVNEIMPLVLGGDKTQPFIVTKDSACGNWRVCRPAPGEAGKSLTGQRNYAPYAVMYDTPLLTGFVGSVGRAFTVGRVLMKDNISAVVKKCVYFLNRMAKAE